MMLNRLISFVIGAVLLNSGVAYSQHLQLLGTLSLPTIELHSISLWQNYAFVGAKSYGTSELMLSIDITDPQCPLLISTTNRWNANYAEDIQIFSGFAIIADRGHGSLIVYDISQPSNPSLASVFTTNDLLHTIVINKNLLYLANCCEGLRIFDISNPDSFIPLGQYIYDEFTFAEGVDVKYPYAYIVTLDHNFIVVNIADPDQPRFSGVCPGQSRYLDVKASGNIAFATTLSSYIELFDITDSANPHSIAMINCIGNTHRLVLYDRYMFVAANGYLALYDISDPYNPEFLEHVACPFSDGGFFDLTVANDIIYTCGPKGIYIYSFIRSGISYPDRELPIASGLVHNYPNPFNCSTTIEFWIPDSRSVSLNIYDFLGRRVANLKTDILRDGFNRIQWKGRDTEGNPLSSGIYFCRLVTDTGMQTSKMILLR